MGQVIGPPSRCSSWPRGTRICLPNRSTAMPVGAVGGEVAGEPARYAAVRPMRSDVGRFLDGEEVRRARLASVVSGLFVISLTRRHASANGGLVTLSP